MKRRYLLQYGTLTTASLAFTACSKGVNQAKPVAFGQPEQKELNIGFVESISSLPLVIAQDKGFFKDQSLTVKLVKFPTWEALQEGLTKGQVDVAQTHFAVPLWSHIKKDKSPIVALMGMTLNGNSIGLSKQAWEGGMRPSTQFNYRIEFGELYNTYVRSFKTLPVFAIDHPASMSSYLARYWLGTMHIHPDKNFKFQVVKGSDLAAGVQSKKIDAYAVEESTHQQLVKSKDGFTAYVDRDIWQGHPDKNFKFQVVKGSDLAAGVQSKKIDAYAVEESTHQQLVKSKDGFTAYVDRDIWQGHPDKILATTAGWAKSNPITAKAVVASVLAACQFCDIERLRKEEDKTPITLAQQLVKPDYLNGGDAKNVKALLTGSYQYDRMNAVAKMPVNIPDFQIFHYIDKLNYLKDPNNANYIWQSHAVWVLTQMVRWNQLNLFEYPKDADKLIAAAYPMDVFREVAKAVGLNLPKETVKKEEKTVFIDKLGFDASEPADYINGFDIRTS